MKLATIVGARPQFVKCAAVSRAIVRLGLGLDEIVIHTGQHYDSMMSDCFFDDLQLPQPTYRLGVGSGTHGAQTGEMLRRIEQVLMQERPHAVAVHGDTNSTLAGALAAAKLCIPIAHVEAGMRSFNRTAPEEVNRVVTDHVASLHLCPSDAALRNLAAEGIVDSVELVGNVMYDALLDTLERARRLSTVLERQGLQPGAYYLVTVHRAENTDDTRRLRSIMSALEVLSATYPVVWPVHPRTAGVLRSMRSDWQPGQVASTTQALRLLEPASYLDMLILEQHARVILTDAGGVTKEAFWLRVPCVTLRAETEWIETVESGWNTLAGADTQSIVDAVRRAVRPESSEAQLHTDVPGASARVALALAKLAANGNARHQPAMEKLG
jgi:UDP-GlcNAc3NAcA epimerase